MAVHRKFTDLKYFFASFESSHNDSSDNKATISSKHRNIHNQMLFYSLKSQVKMQWWHREI